MVVPTAGCNINAFPGTPGTPFQPEQAKSVKLFQPFQQKSVTFHNRIGVPPMCMYSAEDGIANDFHLMHYGSLAMKGPGLIIIEATAVTPEGRITPKDLGLWNDNQIEPLSRLVSAIKSQGTVPGIQIGHAGRKASSAPPFLGDYIESESDGGWPNKVVGPTEERYVDHYALPHALTVDEIKDLVQSFSDAAVRADKAGVEVLEIHGAHGYLISSFLSGNSNKRTDEYGGSFENRIRFLLEVVRAVRAVWPAEKPFWVRISCAEYVNPEPMGHDSNGWDIYQSIELAKQLKEAGVDLIDCSSGGITSGVKYPATPMYQVQFAEAVRKEANIETAAVGLILNGEDAENILQKDWADFILIGREFLRNSAFVQHAGQDLNMEVKWPKQYSWAVKKARRHNKQKVNTEETLTTIP